MSATVDADVCSNGHPWSENTCLRSDGKRRCKACWRNYMREYRKRGIGVGERRASSIRVVTISKRGRAASEHRVAGVKAVVIGKCGTGASERRASSTRGLVWLDERWPLPNCEHDPIDWWQQPGGQEAGRWRCRACRRVKAKRGRGVSARRASGAMTISSPWRIPLAGGARDQISVPDPFPARHLRQRLTEARAAGITFDDAWLAAMADVDEDWREVFRATEDEWRSAYLGEPSKHCGRIGALHVFTEEP